MSIHPDWDVERATAHLAMLRGRLDREEAVAEAFQREAENADWEADQTRRQNRHCESMFASPRPSQPALEDLRTVGKAAR